MPEQYPSLFVVLFVLVLRILCVVLCVVLFFAVPAIVRPPAAPGRLRSPAADERQNVLVSAAEHRRAPADYDVIDDR